MKSWLTWAAAFNLLSTMTSQSGAQVKGKTLGACRRSSSGVIGACDLAFAGRVCPPQSCSCFRGGRVGRGDGSHDRGAP